MKPGSPPLLSGRADCPGCEGAWVGRCDPFLPFPVSNILKAATSEGESSSAKPHRNLASSNHVAQSNAGVTPGPLRRKEVTEEEAER